MLAYRVGLSIDQMRGRLSTSSIPAEPYYSSFCSTSYSSNSNLILKQCLKLTLHVSVLVVSGQPPSLRNYVVEKGTLKQISVHMNSLFSLGGVAWSTLYLGLACPAILNGANGADIGGLTKHHKFRHPSWTYNAFYPWSPSLDSRSRS
jgi:hypothetical protein